MKLEASVDLEERPDMGASNGEMRLSEKVVPCISGLNGMATPKKPVVQIRDIMMICRALQHSASYLSAFIGLAKLENNH